MNIRKYIPDRKTIIFIVLISIFLLSTLGIHVKDFILGWFDDVSPAPAYAPSLEDGTLFESGSTFILGEDAGEPTPLPTFGSILSNPHVHQLVEHRGNDIQQF